MKKTKLLTSLAALALVLSVGACEVNVEIGDVDVGVDVNPNDSSEDTSEDESTGESTSEDETTSESTSEDNTSEDTSEGESTSDTTQNPGVEDEEAKKKAADLEEVQEAITGLGVDYFSSWEAYKYNLTGDYEEERLLTTKDNYTYGYSFDDYSKTYYVDGISYTIENGQYTKGTASSYIYTFNFSEDNYDAAEALDTISEATVDDIDEITIDDDTYTVTNTVVDDWGVLGCYTYQNEYVIKISETTLVSVTINQTTTKEAGSIDTSAYTSTNKEAIECVNPEDITLDVIKAAGFDEELWREPTELEIAQAILESVSEVNSLASLGAVHVEGYDDDYDETTTMDMTTDSNGDLYGVWETYDSYAETDTFYYYYQGVRYELEIASNGEEERDTKDTYLGNLAGLLSDYDDALDAAPDKDEIEEGDFELTTTANGYELKVTISGGYGFASWSADLTIKTDLEFNLTGIEYYQDEDYYYSVDQITYAAVTAAMSDFSLLDWGIATTPAEMLQQIYQEGCYSVELEYDVYQSSETLTYGEYQTDSAKRAEVQASVGIASSNVFDVYYTEDVVVNEAYEYDFGGANQYVFQYVEIFANDGQGGCDYYYSENLEEYSTYHYDFEWGDAFYTLGTAYSYGYSTLFSYYGSGTFNGIPCDAYSIPSRYATYAAYLFMMIGTDVTLGQSYAYNYASSYTHYLTYFMQSIQEMVFNYYRAGWFYNDDSLTSNTILWYADYEIYSTVYDVGNTEIPSYYY